MFIYNKDMERVMQAKKREILGEMENHKLRILKELSCVDKTTLTRLREIISDYNRIEYEITARINQINQATVEFMNLYDVKFDEVVKFYETKINDFNGEFTELFTRYDSDLTAKYTELVNFKSEWENTLSATNASAQETFNATNASAQETFNATNASAQELYNAFVDAKTADYNTKVADWESRISTLESQYATKESEWATAVDGIVSGDTIRGLEEEDAEIRGLVNTVSGNVFELKMQTLPEITGRFLYGVMEAGKTYKLTGQLYNPALLILHPTHYTTTDCAIYVLTDRQPCEAVKKGTSATFTISSGSSIGSYTITCSDSTNYLFLNPSGTAKMTLQEE